MSAVWDGQGGGESDAGVCLTLALARNRGQSRAFKVDVSLAYGGAQS